MRARMRALGVRVPIEVLPIWVDTDAIRPLPPFTGSPTLLYSGNLGRKQGLGQVVALAETLQQSRPDITVLVRGAGSRSEKHTSELQSLMRISYAVFCLKKKTQEQRDRQTTNTSEY